LVFWGLFVALLAICVSVLLWWLPSKEPKPAGIKQQPISDSLLHHQKNLKDSLKRR
jgi:hypothetical protein